MDDEKQPRTEYEKLWLETAAPHAQFVCRRCGVLRDFIKTDVPCLYECPICHSDIDERSTMGRIRMARLDYPRHE